jgi:hypothetical protein
MKFHLSFALAAVLTAAGSSAALAQNASPVGQWGCNMTFTELNQFGNRTSGYAQEYRIAVYQNGTFDVGGTTMGVSGYSQFQGQGQWQLQQNVFIAQGQAQEQSSFGIMPTMFMMLGTLSPDGGGMSFTNESPDPSGTYIMSRSHYLCQRQG